MRSRLGPRIRVSAWAFAAFVAGASLTLFSEDAKNDSVGDALLREYRALDEEHGKEMGELRAGLRSVLKTVGRAKSDPALAAEAEAAPQKLTALLNKLLDAEAGYRVKRDSGLVAKRDALVAELSQYLLNGKAAHPRLLCDLLPSVTGSDSQRAEWNDLFKVIRRAGRFDDEGGEDEEGVD